MRNLDTTNGLEDWDRMDVIISFLERFVACFKLVARCDALDVTLV